jgi:signal peptidase II
VSSPPSSTVWQAIVSAVLMVGVLVLYLRRFAPPSRWVIVAVAVCALDQAVKALIAPSLQGRRVPLFGGWLTLTYAENWEQGFGGSLSYLLLITAVCVAALYLLYERLARTKYRMSVLAELGCALMIGGYLGILLDRMRLGFVVDLLEFGRASPFVYNLADLAVFLALALFLTRGMQFLAQARARRIGLQDKIV